MVSMLPAATLPPLRHLSAMYTQTRSSLLHHRRLHRTRQSATFRRHELLRRRRQILLHRPVPRRNFRAPCPTVGLLSTGYAISLGIRQCLDPVPSCTHGRSHAHALLDGICCCRILRLADRRRFGRQDDARVSHRCEAALHCNAWCEFSFRLWAAVAAQLGVPGAHRLQADERRNLLGQHQDSHNRCRNSVQCDYKNLNCYIRATKWRQNLVFFLLLSIFCFCITVQMVCADLEVLEILKFPGWKSCEKVLGL